MKRIPRLFELAKNFYTDDDPGHDLAHIERVMKTCGSLAALEQADPAITLAGALLHDIVNLPKDHPERKNASRMAAARAQGLLAESGFSPSEIAHVQQVILEHSFSLGLRPSSIEAAVVQDADRLDALGAIGILRATTCGSRLGASYYHRQDPLASDRPLDDKSFTIDHFFTKLFKLPELMNTASAKAEAAKRVEFMRGFLQQLEQEITR